MTLPQKNILHYVAATSLSSHLTTYRGNHGTKLVTQKLMELVLDLPENLRHDIAGMIKLEDAVSEAFTQRRSTIKKEVSFQCLRSNNIVDILCSCVTQSARNTLAVFTNPSKRTNVLISLG